MALLAVVFYSCEDVPAPYEINNNGKKTDVIYRETFASSLGKWKNIVVSGTGGWKNDYSTACATGRDNTTKVTTPVTAYLVSPVVSLEDVDTAHVTYEYVLCYKKADVNQQVLIIDADTYASSADPNAVKWTVLNDAHPATADYKNFETIDVNVPEQFMGKKVVFAFFYNCAEEGSTWEVKNFIVLKGEANDNPGPGPVGENLLTNSGFEDWSGNSPVNWVSSTSASTAVLAQSTDAHSGNYSVQVEGNPSANKRLAYTEVTLLPGTYYIRFYAKAVTADGASARPGYVPVVNGAAVSSSYNYGDYVNGITNTEWTEATHSFTLTETTTVNLLVMNPKQPGTAVLIDDFELFTADGGLADNPGPGPKPGPSDVKTVTIAEFNSASVGDQYYQLTGTVSGLKSDDLYGNFNLTDSTATVYVYGLLSEAGGAKKQFQELAAAKGIVEGCTLTLVGKRGEYNGNIEVTDAYFVSCEGGGTPTPPTPPDPVEGKKLSEFKNGGFETWVDDKTPELWKSSTTASSATLAKSTDAHSGSYAVQVQGATSGNKRLASTELALEAGTYTYSFYAKGDGAAAAVASGYVPVTSSGVGNYEYVKDGTKVVYTDVTPAEWTKISGTFTLTAATTVNLVIMNSKNPGGTVLIDDYTITKQ
ncbi:MAG: carbohydrate binding domain-containing protein [Bacteroidales bacterium]|nr:carbohydrate binding domain-containing protein [Bacteroidales bacterium]